MEMNLQLHHVVSDITGVTGMRIIRSHCRGREQPRCPGDLPRCALPFPNIPHLKSARKALAAAGEV
jgi:hypothetical protein